MINYLFDSGGKIIGLDGTVYNGAPTAEEIVSLQQYSQKYVNDEEGYREAFNKNVAPLLGAGASSVLGASYTSDDSCLPSVCGIEAEVIAERREDMCGGNPCVTSSTYVNEMGCRVITLTFYNLVQDCTCQGGGNAFRHLYGDSNSGFRGCGSSVPNTISGSPEGMDMLGLMLVTGQETQEDINNPCNYAWMYIPEMTGSNSATYYVAYAFTRTVRQLTNADTPTGFNEQEAIPDPRVQHGLTWSDGVPSTSNYPIWMTSCKVWSDRETNAEHAIRWSVPACMGDSKIFQTEWASADTNSDACYQGLRTLPPLNDFIDESPSNFEGIDETGWRNAARAALCGEWSDRAEGATYMAWSNRRNGVWDAWTIAKIRGERGLSATPGRQFMIFKSLPEDQIPETPTGGHWLITGNTLECPTGWNDSNDSQPGLITWVSFGSFDGIEGNLINPPGWSEPVRITGADGKDGVDGDNIEFIFARFEDVESYLCYASGTTITGEECADQSCKDEKDEVLGARDIEHSTNGTPWEDRDYIPFMPGTDHPCAVWLDHPLGIEIESEDGKDWRVEACCMRQKTEHEDPNNPGEMISEWSDWVGPFIWASWGEDGIDGDGIEYIYCVTSQAQKSCKYTPLKNAPTEEQIAYAEERQEVPDTTNYSDYDCDNEPSYIVIGSGATATYYEKVVSYRFPEINALFPPVNFNEACASQDSCSHCETSLYRGLCYGESGYDVKKRILDEYYQKSEFVPSEERITRDWNERHQEWSVFKDILVEYPEYDTDEIPSFLRALDANWTDNPLDVGPQQPYEWVAVRKYKAGTHDTTKEWQPFSEPKLWANWAFDGTSNFTSMVFTRTNDDISGMQLCGGTFEEPYPGAFSEDEPLPDGCGNRYDRFTKRSEVQYKLCNSCDTKTYYWYDTVPSDLDYYYDIVGECGDGGVIPAGYESVPVSEIWPEVDENSPDKYAYRKPNGTICYYEKKHSPLNSCIWMSMRTFGDNITGQNQGWTSPRRMSDTADFNVEWCLTNLSPQQIAVMKSNEMNFGNFVKAVEDQGIIDDDLHTTAETLFEQCASTYTSLDCPDGLGEWSDKGDGAIYMATSTFRNGRWTNWTVSKIKGEKGDAGTSIRLYGSTKGVVKDYSALTTCVVNSNPQVGDLWLVLLTPDSYIPCDFDPYRGHTQFFEYVGGNRGWECLACREYFAYEACEETEYSEAVNKAEVAAIPSNITDQSPEYIHVAGTGEYYKKVTKKFVDEGLTVIVNGIEESGSGCQGISADDIQEDYGIINGDFFVWDNDSWRRVTNLMGPGSYVHIKFASHHIDGKYRLTEDPYGEMNPGEMPGKYMGTYVDDNKADFMPTERVREQEWDGTIHYYYYVNDEYHENPGPYKWLQVEGDDGLGYEYIYMTSLKDDISASGYVQDGRPFTPVFKPGFITGSTYQEDGFVPTSLYQSYLQTPADYCGDWSDNPVSCDIDDRFRWKCYRMKVNGVWTQFYGDKSTATGSAPLGRYATFDANYSVDGESMLVCDFENDTCALGCTDEGMTAEEIPFVLKPLMYKGSTAFTVTSCTLTDGGDIITSHDVTASTNPSESNPLTITIGVPVGSEVYPSVHLKFALSGWRYDPVTGDRVTESGEATATVMGVKGSVIYSLVVSKSCIKKDGNGHLTDDSPLECNVLKRVVGTTDYVEVSTSDPNVRVKYSIDSSTAETSFTTASQTFDDPLAQEAINEKVTFKLYTKRDPSAGWGSTNLVLNDVETVYVVSDGEPGDAGFIVDLDNESDGVPLTYEGAVDGMGDYIYCETVISVHYGTEPGQILGVSANTATTDVGAVRVNDVSVNPGASWSTLATGTTATNSTPHQVAGIRREAEIVTVRIEDGWTGFPASPLEIRLYVSVEYNGKTAINAVTFTLTGIKAGSPGEHATIYQLIPGSSFIVKHENGEREPNPIFCNVVMKNGTTVTSSTASNFNLKIMWGSDDQEGYPYTYSELTGVSTTEIDKHIKFALIPGTDNAVTTANMHDREIVPLVKDGTTGKGLLANCNFWMANNFSDSTDPNFPLRSDSRWVKDGSWFADGDFENKQTSNNTIPLPDANNLYLWKWEKYWYTDHTTFESNFCRVSDESRKITGIEKWYKIAVKTAENTQLIINKYRAVESGDMAPGDFFINLADQAPRELTYTNEGPEARWEFMIFRFSDGQDEYPGIEIVDEYYMALKDLEVLRSLFGEANVEAKHGAYLREFLGVMEGPMPGTGSSITWDVEEGRVKAFLNATYNWTDDSNALEDKGRIMFASGVSRLGGVGTYGNKPNIDMSRFEATTIIWENGTIECKNLRAEGVIHAWEGSFGGDKDTPGCVLVNSSGITAVDGNGDETFTLSEDGARFRGKIEAQEIIATSSTVVGNFTNTLQFFVTTAGTFSLFCGKEHRLTNQSYSVQMSESGLEITSKSSNAYNGELIITSLNNGSVSVSKGADVQSSGSKMSPDSIIVKNVDTYGQTTITDQSVKVEDTSSSAYAEMTETSFAIHTRAGGDVIRLSTTGGGNIDCGGSIDCGGNMDCGGSIDCDGTLHSGGRISCDDRITSQVGFYQTSDATKKNVGEPLKDVLSKVDAVPTIYYTWKDDKEANQQIGTLAQNVEEVFPELVSAGLDGYTVDYSRLSIVALAAIKELKEQVEELKDEIRRLKENR